MKKVKLISVILVFAIMLSSCASSSFNKAGERVVSRDILAPEDPDITNASMENYYLAEAYNVSGLDENEFVIDVLGSGNNIFTVAEMQPPLPTGYRLLCNNKVIYTSYRYFYAATANADCIWLLENEVIDGISHYFLQQLTATGENAQTIELSTLYDGTAYSRTIVYAQDTIYLVSNSKELIAVGISGKLKWASNLPSESSYPVSAKDKLYVVEPTNVGNDLFCVDTDSGSLKKDLSCMEGNIASGNSDYFLLICNNDGIYSLLEDGSTNTILIWENCGIAVNGLISLSTISDSRFLIMTNSGAQILSLTSNKNYAKKTVLEIATIGSDNNLQKLVTSFNYNSSHYQIQIKDYSESNSIDLSTALTRLNTEILSGRYPDLICFSNISPYPYIAKELLEDMGSSIFNGRINLDNIAIKNALGKQIYYISGTFDFETLVAKYSDFGDAYGWTMSEYLNIEKNLPSNVETIHNMTQESFVEYIVSRYVREAVDWENGTCLFDTPEFIELLEAGSRIRKTPEDANNMIYGYGSTLVGEGSQVAALSWVEDVWKLAFEEYMAGCKLSFIGWPTVDGSCGSDVHLISPVGIFRYGDNLEGCREFVEYMILNADTSSTFLPIYSELLKDIIEAAEKNSELPMKLTENDVNRFWSLLSHMQNISLYDDNVMAIVRRECKYCFSGDKTAAEVAKLIQSKVSLYIAEQQ